MFFHTEGFGTGLGRCSYTGQGTMGSHFSYSCWDRSPTTIVIGAYMPPNHHTFLMLEVCNMQHCSLRICFGHVPSLSAIWSNTTQRSS